MIYTIQSRGSGKTLMSELIIKSVFDGDLETKMNGVNHSTSVREIFTLGQMIEYGKGILGVKGNVIDERV